MPETHLHEDDCPAAVLLLRAVCDRPAPPDGYRRTDVGAFVDWDALDGSYLSSTERAAVHVAHGLAIAERHGGFGPLTIEVYAAAATLLIGAGR
jgi:hypothetical protein